MLSRPQQDFINTTTVLVAVLLILLGLYMWQISDRHNYPPGPLPLPYIGWAHRLLITNNPFKEINDMCSKFGEVITLGLPGGEKWVILNSPRAIQEGFVKNAKLLSERHSSHTVLYDSQDFAEPDGRWQILRKHLASVLRGNGIGSQGLEHRIHDEIQHFIRALELSAEEPIDLENLLSSSTSNLITNALFGGRLDYSDNDLENLRFGTYAGLTFLENSVPAVKYFPLDQMVGYNKERKKAEKGMKLIMKKITEHKERFKPDEAPKDYIDSFLMAQHKDGGTEDSVFNDSNLIGVAANTYLAGTDTTSQALYWIFLYLVLYPDVQEKIYTEITHSIGEKQSQYSDRSLLPYTMSVLTEIMRCSMVTPSTGPHQAKQDVTVCGVTIPKGVRVTANLLSGCLDPVVFPEPDVFKPDRFLDKNGSFTPPDSTYFTPFGAGPRVCLGQHLAKMQIFLYVTSTLVRFEVVLGQQEIPTLKNGVKFVAVPEKNYLVRMKKRV